RALEANPRHVPSLLTAGQLALETQDWAGAVEYADALARVQPDAAEAHRWRAVARENQGRRDEARKEYEELATSHPELAVGYLGVAHLLEKSGDRGGALTWVERCQSKVPNDLGGLRSQVKLLTLLDRGSEATAAADQAVTAQTEQLRETQAAALKAQP